MKLSSIPNHNWCEDLGSSPVIRYQALRCVHGSAEGDLLVIVITEGLVGSFLSCANEDRG